MSELHKLHLTSAATFCSGKGRCECVCVCMHMHVHLSVYVCEKPSNDYVHLTQYLSLGPDSSEVLVEERFSDNHDGMLRNDSLMCPGVKHPASWDSSRRLAC